MAMLQLDDIEGCLLESSDVELANDEMNSTSLSAGQANLQPAVHDNTRHVHTTPYPVHEWRYSIEKLGQDAVLACGRLLVIYERTGSLWDGFDICMSQAGVTVTVVPFPTHQKLPPRGTCLNRV
jgi:hypothetical protein